jgi:hypothetical protein
MCSVSAEESRSTSYPQSTCPLALSYVTVNHTHRITQLNGSENHFLLEFWVLRRVVSLRFVLVCAGSKKITHLFLHLFLSGYKFYLWHRMLLKQLVLTTFRRPELKFSLRCNSEKISVILCNFILRRSAQLYSVQCVLLFNCFPTCEFVLLLLVIAIHWQKKPWKIFGKGQMKKEFTRTVCQKINRLERIERP